MTKTKSKRRELAHLRLHIKELESRVRDLAALAFSDPLTGLQNRRGLDRALDAALAAAEGPVSCLLIDLDRFKDVNDHHGHLAGDALLRRVANHLRAACRAGDVVGRFGGDEFLVVLPGADEATARARLQAVLASLRSCGDAPDGVAASGGWGTIRRRGPDALRELLGSADRRLLESKPIQPRGVPEVTVAASL